MNKKKNALYIMSYTLLYIQSDKGNEQTFQVGSSVVRQGRGNCRAVLLQLRTLVETAPSDDDVANVRG